MNTTNESEDWMIKRAKTIEGTGKLIKSSSLLIAAIISAVGVILLAIWEFPTYPVPNPVPPVYQPQQPDKTEAYKRDEVVPDPIPPSYNQGVSIAGNWYDDQGNVVRITQEGNGIGVEMAGISDNVPYQLSGTGSLVNQSANLILNCQTLGLPVGQIPATLTFANSGKATVTFAFAGVPITAELHR